MKLVAWPFTSIPAAPSITTRATKMSCFLRSDPFGLAARPSPGHLWPDRALGASANMRDCLFGHPDGVGEEGVVRQGREVSVAGGDPRRGRRIANDYNLEALLHPSGHRWAGTGLRMTLRPGRRARVSPWLLPWPTGEIRPDWDLSTPGLREAWDKGDYSKFHGWDRRAPGSVPTSYD